MEFTRVKREARDTPLLLSATVYLRIFGVLSVVWFHTPGVPFRELAGPGVAAFLCLSFMHTTRAGTLGPSVKRITKRVLGIWAVWWTFYALVWIWMDGIPVKHLENLSLTTLLVWPSVHLWFMPFIYVNSLIALTANLAMRSWRLPTKTVATATAGVALLIANPYVTTLGSGLRQWWSSEAILGIGMALGYALQMRGRKGQVAFVLVAGLLAVIGGWSLGRVNSLLGWACVGGGLTMLLCLIPMSRSRFLTRLSILSRGVYLVHPFVALVIIKFFGSDLHFALMFTAVVVTSTLMTHVMRRTPYLRRVV